MCFASFVFLSGTSTLSVVSQDVQTAGLGSGSAGRTSVQTGVLVPSEVISQLFDLGAKKYVNMLGSV